MFTSELWTWLCTCVLLLTEW